MERLKGGRILAALRVIGRRQRISSKRKLHPIVLSRAKKIVIPLTLNILISAFKDTSRVVISALFDLLKTTQTVISNPEWMSCRREALVLIALLYFLG